MGFTLEIAINIMIPERDKKVACQKIYAISMQTNGLIYKSPNQYIFEIPLQFFVKVMTCT